MIVLSRWPAPGLMTTGVAPEGPEPSPKLKRGRTMQENSELFVGLDTSKLKISVAVAEGERNGEVGRTEEPHHQGSDRQALPLR